MPLRFARAAGALDQKRCRPSRAPAFATCTRPSAITIAVYEESNKESNKERTHDALRLASATALSYRGLARARWCHQAESRRFRSRGDPRIFAFGQRRF